MFFFGIFSTHLPYIVLAVLYLVGFGAYSVNNVKEKAVQISSDKTIQISHKLQSAHQPDKTFYYSYNYRQIQHNSILKLPLQGVYFRSLRNHKYFERLGLFQTSQITFSLFSRPPPSC